VNSIGDLEKVALNYPKDVVKCGKNWIKFLDTFAALNNDSNMKVQTKSLEAFQQLVPLLAVKKFQ